MSAGCHGPGRRSKRLLLVAAAVVFIVFYLSGIARQLGISTSAESASAKDSNWHHLGGRRVEEQQATDTAVRAVGVINNGPHAPKPDAPQLNIVANARIVGDGVGVGTVDELPITFGSDGVDWSTVCGRSGGHKSGQCTKELCGGSLVAVGNGFAFLRSVQVSRLRGRGRIGGESVEDVINQAEDAEYWQLQSGFFDLSNQSPCAGDGAAGLDRRYTFDKDSHLNKWLAAVVAKDDLSAAATNAIRRFTIAVTRYEYVNLYHTMTDFYNAYLVARYFGQRPEDVSVLFVDGHPAGSLDSTWGKLFGGGYVRVGELPPTVRYERLAWGWLGYASPLMSHNDPAPRPLIDEFRRYFLERHGIAAEAHQRDCARLRILFVWRRDYVAHPRNPGGSVSRKVKNEDELLSAVRSKYPGAEVTGQQTDLLPVGDQLKLIAQTDLLVGMHGAGLTLALFLPPGSGLAELYPTYWSSSNEHFKAIATWRRLPYARWQNRDASLEDAQKRSYVPPATLLSLVDDVIRQMCP